MRPCCSGGLPLCLTRTPDSGLKSGLWSVITASDKTAVSSRSWFERNIMSCADEMQQVNASPLGTERGRVSLKRAKAQVNPELWQDPSVLVVKTALVTEGPAPWGWGAAGELLSDPHPRAQGASPAATPGLSFSSNQGRSRQQLKKGQQQSPPRHHILWGYSFHHTATPPKGEAGMTLLWHKKKLSSHPSQKDRAPPICGTD